MNLSTHFTLEELTFSETGERRGLRNEPPLALLVNLRRVADTLEKVRAIVNRPIFVSSGYRSPEINALVGGSPNSAHMLGLAADIRASGMTPRELAEAIRDYGVKLDQLILEYDRWVHIGLTTGTPRGQVLTIRKGTGYMTGLV